MSDDESERQIRVSVAHQLSGRGVSRADKQRLVRNAHAALGEHEAYLAYQRQLAVLWGRYQPNDTPEVGLLLVYAIDGLVAAEVTPENCAHAAYLSMAYVHDPMTDFEDEWARLYARFSKVPLTYVEDARILPSAESICERAFLWVVTEAWEAGVEQEYVHVVPIVGRRLSPRTKGRYQKETGCGYSVADVLRIQEAGIDPHYAHMVFYEEPDAETAACLRWASAGAPFDFAYQMYANGVPSERAAQLFTDGVPLEYASALGGAQ